MRNKIIHQKKDSDGTDIVLKGEQSGTGSDIFLGEENRIIRKWGFMPEDKVMHG